MLCVVQKHLISLKSLEPLGPKTLVFALMLYAHFIVMMMGMMREDYNLMSGKERNEESILDTKSAQVRRENHRFE